MKKYFLLPKSARGQSLVELAISLVILLYLLSGAVEFGILFFQYVQLRDAAQEGALYASIHPGDLEKIETRARASSGTSPIDLSAVAGKATVEIFIDDVLVRSNGVNTAAAATAHDCEGYPVRVEVSYTHHIFMPFMPKLIAREDITLVGSVTDTILTPPPPC
jgi:Flp pilus assembly protein TadG